MEHQPTGKTLKIKKGKKWKKREKNTLKKWELEKFFEDFVYTNIKTS